MPRGKGGRGGGGGDSGISCPKAAALPAQLSLTGDASDHSERHKTAENAFEESFLRRTSDFLSCICSGRGGRSFRVGLLEVHWRETFANPKTKSNATVELAAFVCLCVLCASVHVWTHPPWECCCPAGWRTPRPRTPAASSAENLSALTHTNTQTHNRGRYSTLRQNCQ